VQSSDAFTAGSAVFDEQNLVSSAGLVPVLELAEQTALSRLIGQHVDLPSTRMRSVAANPTGKLTSIIAAMICGAGILLREFTLGHANQHAAVGRAHLVALGQRVALLPGIGASGNDRYP
jgi:hypothetical protein